MDGGSCAAPASRRVRLNVGGKRFETTVGTLTQGGGKSLNFFSSIVRHEPPDEGDELFVDRDGEAFGPLLSYLRTGYLHIPPGVSEAAVRCEAEFYCIALPQEEPPAVGAVRFDGLYLSFGAAPRINAAEDEDAFAERGSVGSTAWLKCPLGSFRASSGRASRLWAARHSQAEVGTLSAQPPPRVLELAACNVADSTACGHPKLMSTFRTKPQPKPSL